jgi:hypothetical protein
MVVDDFEVLRIVIDPSKHDAPLVVDADGMLPGKVSLK